METQQQQNKDKSGIASAFVEPPNKRQRPSEEKTVFSLDESQKPTVQAKKLLSIPRFDVRSKDFSPGQFLKAYETFQAIHLPNFFSNKNLAETNSITWRDIRGIFQNLSQSDKDSWCIETKGRDKATAHSPDIFLAPQLAEERAYCSFLVQKDKEAYSEMLKRLPVPNLNFDQKWKYEPCVWVFFGRNKAKNNDNEPLEGRGLHTDSVSHDGTWHFQLSGIKDWFLSPSCNLLEHWKSFPTPAEEFSAEQWDDSTKVHVPCNEGDVIVVNTRLWFHRTVIPSQENPSVSYARDFRLDTSDTTTKTDNGDGAMTNLDGLYARKDIEGGTIIFTEKDMPDCELHRSKDDPNCEVVELEDGTSAVVSRRSIKCGEFFCVAESSDEEDYDEEEGEESEDDEGLFEEED